MKNSLINNSEEDFINRKLKKLLNITNNMNSNQKELFVKDLRIKLNNITKELNSIDRSLDFVQKDNFGYITENKKRLIGLTIEVMACVVGGVIGGIAPGLNFLLGVAYGFLISLPIQLMFELNIETRFIHKILTKLEINMYKKRKKSLLINKSLTEKTIEQLNKA